jgi:tetratricopeptide (TPR) repeat protein
LIWTGLTIVVLGSGLLTIGVAGKIQAQRLQAELAQVRQMMDRGRPAAAYKKLADLAQHRPGDGQVLFLLGHCEELLGRPDRALAAWAQVPVSDPNYARAAESQGAVLINQGRFAPAEVLLLDALRKAPETDRYPVLRGLGRLLRLEGRYRDVSDVLTAAWSLAPEPSEVLQELWRNDTEPVPVDGWKVFLDEADQQDDRVWLGKARHAILTGRFDEARTWLDRCLGRRPDDPTVWRACLDLAVAARDIGRFWEAAGRIPAGAISPSETQVLRFWLVARGDDRQAERRELARLVEIQPANSATLERLAVLALEAGDSAEAQRIQARKTEVDRAKNFIRRLVVTLSEFRPHARELARLSAVQGRPFDEQAWSLVAASLPGQAPGAESGLKQSQAYCRAASEKALAHLLAQAGSPPSPGSLAIADRLADLRGARVVGREPGTGPAESSSATRSRLHFVDDAQASGLRFVFDNGRTSASACFLPESLSGGVGLVDYDGDGWLDDYCVQGGSLTAAPGAGATAAPAPGDRLFRNQGDGTFRDVTRQSGIDRLTWGRGYGQGISVGDFDNDGHPDLFITRLFRYDLFRNRGDGTFEDVTERQGLAGPRENPTSSAFADLDNDGDLDLYVCHYVRSDPDHPVICKHENGECFYCDPAKYERSVDHVFRNDRGRFVEVTEAAGFTDPDGHGLGVVAADIDDDNRIDLFVANDGTANYLFRNRGGFRFEDEALMAGVSGGAQGGYQAGMGVAAADLDGDGRLDLLVTNLYLEGTTLYHNLGQGMFADLSAPSGILQSTRYLLGFGIGVIDATNDGRPDVVITNGNMNDFRPMYPYAMPTRLYEGRPGGRLVDVSDRAGPPWAVPRLGRGLATGDLDNDGRPDLLVMGQNEPLAYFHNRTDHPGHFVTFRLEGTRSNRDGVGARVVITTAEGRQVAQRLGGGSYLSACDGRLHFGLGASTSIQSVEVRWPSGRLDRWTHLVADTGYLLREGDPLTKPLAGFSRPSAPARQAARGADEASAPAPGQPGSPMTSAGSSLPGLLGVDLSGRDGIQLGGEQLGQGAAGPGLDHIPSTKAGQLSSDVAARGSHLGREGQEDPGLEPAAELFGQAGQLRRIPHRLVALEAFLVPIPDSFELGLLPSEFVGIGRLAGLARQIDQPVPGDEVGGRVGDRELQRAAFGRGVAAVCGQPDRQPVDLGRGRLRGLEMLEGLPHPSDPVRRHGPTQVGSPGGDILGTAPQAGRQPPRRLVKRAPADRHASARQPDPIVLRGQPPGLLHDRPAKSRLRALPVQPLVVLDQFHGLVQIAIGRSVQVVPGGLEQAPRLLDASFLPVERDQEPAQDRAVDAGLGQGLQDEPLGVSLPPELGQQVGAAQDGLRAERRAGPDPRPGRVGRIEPPPRLLAGPQEVGRLVPTGLRASMMASWRAAASYRPTCISLRACARDDRARCASHHLQPHQASPPAAARTSSCLRIDGRCRMLPIILL